GRPITRDAVFDACRKAARRAGISKPVHPHSLRHYAASRTMPRVEVVGANSRRSSGIDAA
ncbi:MAG: tyrosine-type recombinase/integrase, partial [Candidatus Sulfotelmatobacter sp.]